MRKVTVLTKSLDAYKRLRMALENDDISRLRALLDQSRRSGRSIHYVLDAIQSVVESVYSAKGYRN